MEDTVENKVVASIATILRKGYGDKADEEMRLELCTFKEKPYLSLRLWWKAADGKMAPSKKGISIRLGELQAVKDALNSHELGQALKPYSRPPQTLQPKPIEASPKRPNPIQADGTIDDGDVF